MHAEDVFRDALLHGHSVAAGRHHRTGENAHAFGVTDDAEIRFTREAGAHAFHHCDAVRNQISMTISPAVHSAVIVARYIKRGEDVCRNDSTQRCANVQPLGGGDRGQRFADEVARLVDGH